MQKIDLTGQQFGKLTVINEAAAPGQWNAVCACGNKVVVRGYALRAGNTRSCGCLRKERGSLGQMRHAKPQPIMGPAEFYDLAGPEIMALKSKMEQAGVTIKKPGYWINGKSYGPFNTPHDALAHAFMHAFKK